MQIFNDVMGFLVARFNHNLFSLIAYFVFVLLADGYFIREYLADIRFMKVARTEWPKTAGKVTSTRFHSGRGYNTIGHPVVGASYGMVTYAYEVGGKAYKKTAYVTTERSELAGLYPKDAELTVYYDPRNPKNGLWEKDVSKTSNGWSFLVFMNLLFLAFGLAVLLINF